MGSKCNVLLDVYCVKQMLDSVVDQEASIIKQQISESHLEAYISDNRRIKYCPSTPFCGFVVKIVDDVSIQQLDVECECGHRFCFACQANAHFPATCKMYDKWKRVISEDAASILWIESNTKPCPGCNAGIEKNMGCNHMFVSCPSFA